MNGRPFGARWSSPPAVLDGRSDRDELGQVRAPFVAADVEADTDDAVRPELVGLLLHPRHRQLASLVHRLREHRHLHRLLPVRLLEADVVDRAADHEPDRVEPGLLDEVELVHRQVRGEQPPLQLREALAPVLGNSFGRVRVVAHVGPPGRVGWGRSRRRRRRPLVLLLRDGGGKASAAQHLLEGKA